MRRIITTCSALAAIVLVAASCHPAGESSDSLKMLVGTFTLTGESTGVYYFDFNQEDATFSAIDTATVGNPTFIVPSADRRFAYSVGEFDDIRKGAVSYTLTDSSVDFLNRQSTDGFASGFSPCNIVIWDGRVWTSNYGGGTVSAFDLREDGTLSPLVAQFKPEWTEPDIQARMHCATISPDGQYLFAVDLGLDAVHRISAGDTTRNLSSTVTAWQFDRNLHPGPRHMVFSADGRYAYLIHELGDLLSTFTYNDGELQLVSTVSAYDGEGHGSADIHLTPDGRFLYTSHRLKEDGISLFKVNADTGVPERVAYFKTGIHPRNFTITPNGKYLLCACRDSNCIQIFAINPEDGTLTDTGKTIEVPTPVCIQLFSMEG